jgi:hypothetical protein
MSSVAAQAVQSVLPSDPKNILRVMLDRLLAAIKRGDSVILTVALVASCFILIKVFCDHSSVNERFFRPHNFFPIHNKNIARVMRYVRGDNYGLHQRKLGGDSQGVRHKKSKAEKPVKPSRPEKYHLMTAWSVSHVLFYALLGFVAPRLWPALVCTSITWEIIEFSVSDCHDVMDLVCNSVGMGIGMGLHKLVYKSF